jgi:tripartite-type tricarboxylate transporter receptor subunit TctC
MIYKNHKSSRLLIMLAGLCALNLTPHNALAQSAVENFYTGKTIDLYIGFTTGGTYDTYARLVAQFMGDHIPGKPKIIPRQMIGAGSRAAAAHMYSLAPKDGTQLATADQAIAMQQVLSDPGIQFDAQKFNWVGNPIADNNTMAAWTASHVTKIQDAIDHEVIVGANGITAAAQYPQAMNVLLGTKFKIITGYPGGTDINLAMERGEVAVRGQNSWSSWKSQHMDWIKEKKISFLVQIGLQKDKELPDVPLLMDLVSNPIDHAALKLLSAPTTIGRPLFTTPDVPTERVSALRKAFSDTMKDQNFINAAAKANMDLNPVSGEELQQIITDLFKTSPEAVQRLKTILAPLEQGR